MKGCEHGVYECSESKIMGREDSSSGSLSGIASLTERGGRR